MRTICVIMISLAVLFDLTDVDDVEAAPQGEAPQGEAPQGEAPQGEQGDLEATPQVNIETTKIPALVQTEVDQWFAYHEGERYFGVYMEHRWVGVVSQSVYKEKRGLSDVFVVINDLKIHKDLLTNTRIYQASAPYSLLSVQWVETKGGEQRSAELKDGVWRAHLPNGETHRVEVGQSRETLRVQVGIDLHLPVGSTWYIPIFESGKDHLLEKKIIDHRFELRGGLWSPVIEVSTHHLSSGKKYRSVVDKFKRVRSMSDSNGLVFVAKTKNNARSKDQLPQLPQTLSLIQSQRGLLDKVFIDQILEKRKTKLNICYQTSIKVNPKTPKQLTLRLDISSDGLLRSVGAVEIESPHLTNCVLRQLDRIRFAPPQNGAGTFAYPLKFTL